MGVDTKGVVVTPCKDVFRVCSLAEAALTKLIATERELMFPGLGGWASDVKKQFSNPDVSLATQAEMARISFKFLGEHRTLSLFFTCDCDHEDLAPKTLSMSMGCSGHSGIFVKSVLHALSLLGPAHYDGNDCDAVDLAPLEEPRPSVLQAVKLGYIRPTSVEDWVPYFKETAGARPDKKSRETFFGVADDVLQHVLGMSDCRARWEQIEELAKSLVAPEPSFLAEFHELRAQQAMVGA